MNILDEFILRLQKLRIVCIYAGVTLFMHCSLGRGLTLAFTPTDEEYFFKEEVHLEKPKSSTAPLKKQTLNRERIFIKMHIHSKTGKDIS